MASCSYGQCAGRGGGASDAAELALLLAPLPITIPGLGAAASAVARGVARAAGRLVGRGGSSVWSKPIYQREKDVEDALGARLGLGTNPNRRAGTDSFPGIDFVKQTRGGQVLTQVMSLDRDVVVP